MGNYRVLVTSAVLTPDMGRHFGIAVPASGGWVAELLKAIRKRYPSLVFGVVTVNSSLETSRFERDGVDYYVLQDRFHRMLDYPRPEVISGFKAVVEDFGPDIIHVNGSEFYYGIALRTAAPDVPSLLTIQGLATQCEEARNRAVPEGVMRRYRTWRDYLAMHARRNRSDLEKDTIKGFSHIVGRTDWDRAHIRALNASCQYYCVNELLRPEFFSAGWDYVKAKKYSVFTNSGGTPAKGIHTLVEAIAILRSEYPCVEARVPGVFLSAGVGRWGGFGSKGYDNYLRDLIKKLGVEECIVGLGTLDASKMASELERAHVFALSSHIENSSNSLAEAMLVGTPCVASYCGGVASMIRDKVQGLMYPVGDSVLLAEHIRTLFEAPSMCCEFSSRSQLCAIERHDENLVAEAAFRVYENVLGRAHKSG